MLDIYTCICICTQVEIYVYISSIVDKSPIMCVYVHIYIYVYIYIYIYIPPALQRWRPLKTNIGCMWAWLGKLTNLHQLEGILTPLGIMGDNWGPLSAPQSGLMVRSVSGFERCPHLWDERDVSRKATRLIGVFFFQEGCRTDCGGVWKGGLEFCA